jgi:hypothetical protein
MLTVSSKFDSTGMTFGKPSFANVSLLSPSLHSIDLVDSAALIERDSMAK